MARQNRYPARCTRCGNRVNALEGYLTGAKGNWKVTHRHCTAGSPTQRRQPASPTSKRPIQPTVRRQDRKRWLWLVGTAAAVIAAVVMFTNGSEPSETALAWHGTSATSTVTPIVDSDSSSVETGSINDLDLPPENRFFEVAATPPTVDRFIVGEFELTLRNGHLTELRGPVEHEVTRTRTVDTGRTYRVGATCQDGSRSSATGRGACSWHGGVSHWLVRDETKQVTDVSTIERVETICHDAACPDLSGPIAFSNVEAAARYVPIVNDVFALHIPQNDLDEQARDPERLLATTLMSDKTLFLRGLLR